MKLVRESEISAGICDFNVELSVVGMFTLVQDMTTDVLGQLGLDGVSLRKKYGCVWVFTRNRIIINKRLLWTDKYTAESYVSFARGVKMDLDTAIKDKDGNIAVYSRVEMCALDLNSMKVRRISDVGVTGDITEKAQMDVRFNRDRCSDMEDVDMITVRSCDIDFIHHTNNISYVRYIMNTFSVDDLTEHPVKEIEIRYREQTHEGDELTLCRGKHDGREYVNVKHGDITAVECDIIRE